MATFGWVLLAIAALVFITVANNAWPWVFARLQRGIALPGEGNPIVPVPPTPEQGGPPSLLPPPGAPIEPQPEPPQGNPIVPTPLPPEQGGPPEFQYDPSALRNILPPP